MDAEDLFKMLMSGPPRRPSSRVSFSDANKEVVKSYQECIKHLWEMSKLMGTSVIVDKYVVASQSFDNNFVIHQTISFNLYTLLSPEQMSDVDKTSDSNLESALLLMKKHAKKNHNYIEAQKEMKEAREKGEIQ